MINSREQLPISRRGIPPHDFDNNGITHNPSARPLVSRKPLGEMGVKIIPNGRPTSSSNSFESKSTTVESFGIKKSAIKLIPLADKPLTQVFQTSVGGGRVYGGGTSKEALQRAKRKKR